MDALDKRLVAINSTMDELYNQLDALYESLVDREYVEAKQAIDAIKIELKSVSDSIKDETKR
jgi:uncharacterized coiled-coil protein SlyX